jgi:hypothetical protein
MELIEGQTLKERIRRKAAVTEQVVKWGCNARMRSMPRTAKATS